MWCLLISAHTTHNLLLIFTSLKNKLRICVMFGFVRNSLAEKALALAITSAKKVCILFTKFNFNFAELIIQTIESIIFILDFPTKNTQIENQQCMFIANFLNSIRYGNCSFIYTHSQMRVFVAWLPLTPRNVEINCFGSTLISIFFFQIVLEPN